MFRIVFIIFVFIISTEPKTKRGKAATKKKGRKQEEEEDDEDGSEIAQKRPSRRKQTEREDGNTAPIQAVLLCTFWSICVPTERKQLLGFIEHMGTKLGNLICYLKKLWTDNPDARVIIFSQVLFCFVVVFGKVMFMMFFCVLVESSTWKIV